MEWQVEWIGLCASALVALSITMRSFFLLRVLNFVGSAVFCVYGLMIGSLSIILLNLFGVVINVYYIIQFKVMPRRREVFDYLFVNPQLDEYTRRFMRFHADDIRRFFPSFDADPDSPFIAGAECCFILRGTLPVSLIIFRRGPDGEIAILLDYAAPEYRDFRNGGFFFDRVAVKIAEKGSVFSAAAQTPLHERYLRRVGFEMVGKSGQAVLFRKEI
jgi:hypothetical protein